MLKSCILRLFSIYLYLKKGDTKPNSYQNNTKELRMKNIEYIFVLKRDYGIP
jgi:hypothetical protein